MKRVVTALLLIPTVLYVTLAGPSWLVFAVTALVAVICYTEYRGIAAGYGAPSGLAGYAAGLLLLAVNPEAGFLAVAILVVVALGLSLRFDDLTKALPGTALWLIGIL